MPGSPPTAGGRRARPSAQTPNHQDTWRGWWVVNDRALLPERIARRAGRVPTTGGETITSEWTRSREALILEDVLPALLRVTDPEGDAPELMLRTGLMALGKAARSDAAAAVLTQWLGDEKASRDVRSAAALGIGLLRRTDPTRQLDARTLDALRAHLVRAIDDDSNPELVRGLSAVSLGLLGDQPFGGGIHVEGRLASQRIWRSLKAKGARQDLTVALLTALGAQPPAGVPDAVRDALADVVSGRPALGRRFDDVERSHALTTYARLKGNGALALLVGLPGARRAPKEVRRAALVALGRIAEDLDDEQRQRAADAMRAALMRAKDPLSRGLVHVASGHILAAHRKADAPLEGDVLALWRQLSAAARKGPVGARGFATIALGLTGRDLPESASGDPRWQKACAEAELLLREGLVSEWGDAEHRGAYAIALGLLGCEAAVGELTALVASDATPGMLRRDAAVALGQIGEARPEVVRALNLALFDRDHRVQAGAAHGLSLLGTADAARRLLGELERADTTGEIRRITEPLGYFADPNVAEALASFVGDGRNGDYARASILVALGNVADPEPRPSLGVLGRHANYPAGTQSLMAAILAR